MFKGKNVLITGCNRGIGKTLVLKFLEKNANVICCVRKIDNQFKDFIDSIKKKNKDNKSFRIWSWRWKKNDRTN